MTNFTRVTEVSFNISPEELAEIFCGYCSLDQAKFFECVGAVSDTWPHHGDIQWMALADDLKEYDYDFGYNVLLSIHRYLND